MQPIKNYNYVKWNMGAVVGNYVIPFGVGSVALDYIPFVFNKTKTFYTKEPNQVSWISEETKLLEQLRKI